jgi:hypothetical protein
MQGVPPSSRWSGALFWSSEYMLQSLFSRNRPVVSKTQESRPGFQQDRPSGGQLCGHTRGVSLASKRSASLLFIASRGIRCGIRVGCGEAKQINACIMHLFDWLNCPNFLRVAGLFMLGGSGCLHMYPFFFYGHIVVFSEQGRAG